jgi:hypothetical protein
MIMTKTTGQRYEVSVFKEKQNFSGAAKNTNTRIRCLKKNIQSTEPKRAAGKKATYQLSK